jgi:hypothetical protein
MCRRRGTSSPVAKFEVAIAWLRALKTGDVAALTALPFAYATTRAKKSCEGKLKTAEALERWVACVRKAEATWLAELDIPGEPPLAEGGTDGAKLAALMKRLAPAPSWARTSMSRDGVVYAFRLAVADDRVTAFALDVSREAG